MRNKNAAVADAQMQAFQVWYDTEPKPPTEEKPKYTQPDDGFIGLICGVLGFLGFIGGFVVIFVAGEAGATDIIEWGLRAIVCFPLAAALLWFVWGVSYLTVHDARYQRKLEQLGWAGYEAELEYWRLIGDEEFGKLSTTDLSVHWAMYDPVYKGRPPEFKTEVLQRQPKRRQPRRIPTGDTELDDLEYRLNNATPGKRHGISLAPPRHIRREAKRLAAQKAQCEAEGKRFIAQVRLPARRTLGVNSAGWISSMPNTAEETALVRRDVESYFTDAGLTITKLWLGRRGMTTGAGGSYETLVVVVRVV